MKNIFNHRANPLKHDGFFRVAFWQLMSFFMLILLIWVNEVLDLSALWFGIGPGHPNFFRGCALTIGVIVIAIVTIGNTFLQQKRLLQDLIVICSRCRKIRVNKNVWSTLDQYVHHHSLTPVSHGLCPDCYGEALHEVNTQKKESRPPSA